MNSSVHDITSNLQEEELIANVEERVDTINALVNQETLPQGYEVDEEGVWLIQEQKEGHSLRTWLSSPLWITGYTRDHKNENHGRILQFQDADGHKHQWTMPMDLLAGDGIKILGVLLNMGLRISPKRKVKEGLLEYIAQCNPVRKARCVSQCGWFKETFVLADETIGYIQGEKVIYQNPDGIESALDTSGSLERWKEKIAQMAIGNSRLLLALSAGFGGPILQLMNHENIGIHLKGSSSLGKSTASFVGNSIWDSPASIRTYRATANGLEGVAAQHNDYLLCLDELSQSSHQEAGQVIYMLGNGMGKSRANNQGLARKQATWRLIFLSNGEIGLSQLLQEGGKKIKAGQEVRLVEIPADTSTFGLFENLHGFEGGKTFSEYLKKACAQYYGAASRAFLKKLVEKKEESIDFVKLVIGGLEQRLPEKASSQVSRVFSHLALITGAGELATHFGITGWNVGEASDGVMKCFEAWLKARGNLGMQEEQAALSQVMSAFELHGESRFSPWERDQNDKSRTVNRMGFRKETSEGLEYYVFTQAFREEVCKGLDHRYVEKICLQHKILIPDTQGNPTRPVRLPGSKNTKRCYCFKTEALSETKE